VNAQVVVPDGRLARTLRVSNGRIDGIDVAPDKGDEVIDLDRSFVFPGLINAHDHLELNSQPRLKWRDKYTNASDWIADFQPRFDSDPALAVTRRRRWTIGCGWAG
jgi:cytosine/adenosine deaminase-related metal-dependent hydrolase